MSASSRSSSAVYVISVAAQLCGAHPQTLRSYEQAGLLAPARTRGGIRLYSDADIALLVRIIELTAQGINLVGVQRIIALEGEVLRLRDQRAGRAAANRSSR